MADAKDTKWQVYRPEWYNERILETYISSPIIDKQNDKIGTDTIKESMDFYMKYGVYSYKHEEMPVGLPLAYKVKDGKVKIRVGVHNKLPMHDRVWEEMKIYGDKGGSSIRGEAEKQEKVCEGDVCHNNISELSLWSVSWVGNRPANPEATVTAVAAAKEQEPVKVTKQVTLDEIEGMVEKIIERRGKKYCLFAKKDKKLLGCHSTRAGAVNQERAIQARRFSKMNKDLDEMLSKMRLKRIDKLMWDIAGTRKCMVQKGIRVIQKKKKPKQDYRSGGKTPRGMKPRRNPPSKTQWSNCVNNARNMRAYGGGPMTTTPKRFCGALWFDYQKFGHKTTGSDRSPKPPKAHAPGQGGKEPGNVQDISGYKFRARMFDTPNWKPDTLTRQNFDRVWNKKR